ncbi:unnamed protein product [Leptosia nina]|uniref:Uncharacterized protein n=1 Tax=Leptosia nina TaxID=320188 RepID=A0AAV1JF37_9NEOP
MPRALLVASASPKIHARTMRPRNPHSLRERHRAPSDRWRDAPVAQRSPVARADPHRISLPCHDLGKNQNLRAGRGESASSSKMAAFVMTARLREFHFAMFVFTKTENCNDQHWLNITRFGYTGGCRRRESDSYEMWYHVSVRRVTERTS